MKEPIPKRSLNFSIYVKRHFYNQALLIDIKEPSSIWIGNICLKSQLVQSTWTNDWTRVEGGIIYRLFPYVPWIYCVYIKNQSDNFPALLFKNYWTYKEGLRHLYNISQSPTGFWSIAVIWRIHEFYTRVFNRQSRDWN